MKTEIWYSVENGGDGSAYPKWMESEELCEIDQKWADEPWAEDCIGHLTIESEAPITILDHIITAEDVEKELIEELNQDYMIQYKKEGEYPEWFERLEGHLKDIQNYVNNRK